MKPEIIDVPPVISGGDHGTAPRLAFELLESKFHPPVARPGIVARAALVNRLAAAQAPVITIVAPPGYGKTTLLAQWAERVWPRVAWVSCDDGDNDPVVLLSALAVALDRIEPIDPAVFWALASSGAGITVVPKFVSAITSMRLPVTLVLDHVEAVTNKRCLNTIAELALHLPLGWQFALASRTKVPLPTARLRLRRREPDLVRDLHSRAAEWYEANAMPEAAIEHAQAAGDHDRVARLVLELAQPVWAGGRVQTVLRWMEWLRDATSAEHYGAIAVHGSLIFALLGQPSAAERWAAAAERVSSAGTLPDGSTMESTLAYLRAILSRDGVDEMRRDAQIAWEGLSPASPYRATMLHTEGISYLVQGDHDRADPILAHAFDVATGANALPLAALILAERCIVAAQRDRWAEVATLAQRAVAIVEAGRFEDYWTSALVYAWAARAALHRGDIPKARYYVGRAARLRPLLTYALPVVSVQALLELARAYIALADPGGSAAVLGQVQEILQQRPDLGVLPKLAEELQSKLAKIKAVAVGASSLTAAELRLLPLLSTHLSFREIGERLHLSSNTVKTQAYSVYRKLGVSSRSGAVTRTRELPRCRIIRRPALRAKSDQLKLTGTVDRFAAVSRRQLAVNVLEVCLDGVDGDVHLAGDLGGVQHV